MDAMDPANWSIVMPAYNEEKVIGTVIEELRARYPQAEVLVVNDGSADGTAAAAAAAGARVVSHPRNRGNGAAIKTGARNASREVIVFMDSDGQHKSEDIVRIVAPLAASPPFDMSVGARTAASDTKVHRDLANWAYNRFSSYLASYPIEDLTSGFRAIPRRTMRRFISLLPNTFSYPTTLTLALIRSGHSVAYVPIVARARTGKSKIRLLRDGIRFLLIMTRVATLFSPMRVFLPVSLAMILGGGTYLACTLILLEQPRFTNFSQTMLISGVIVFMLGLVAEQIAQLRLDRTDGEIQVVREEEKRS